jgi:hypothetical protein
MIAPPVARPRTIQIARLYGFCPVQADGFVDGLPFYFRARHDYWVFAIAATPDIDPVQVAIENAPGFRMMRRYGRRDNCDASFMSHTQARVFIESTAYYYLHGEEKTAC